MSTYPLAALTASLLRFDVAGIAGTIGTAGTASTAGKAGKAGGGGRGIGGGGGRAKRVRREGPEGTLIGQHCVIYVPNFKHCNAQTLRY
jgi:hypothetical protein